MAGVEFEEENIITKGVPRRSMATPALSTEDASGMTGWLLRFGLGKNQANIVLIIISLIAFGIAIGIFVKVNMRKVVTEVYIEDIPEDIRMHLSADILSKIPSKNKTQ